MPELTERDWLEASDAWRAHIEEERLDACIEIAYKIERGVSTPTEDLTLIAHLNALREAARDRGPGADE